MGFGSGTRRFIRDETGATAIEYGLIAAMMAVVIIGIAGTGGALEFIYETCRRLIAAIEGSGGAEAGDG